MAKKKNVFQRYFENFGLKQTCDILMVISLVLLILGWILWKSTNEILLLIAFGLFTLTSALSIIRCISIIRSEPNKRSPERRAAMVNMIIMFIVFAVALFSLIWGVLVGYAIPAIN